MSYPPYPGPNQRGDNVPTRDALLALLGERGAPMTLEEIAVALDVFDSRSRTGLSRRLAAMQRDGQIVRNRRGGYGLVEKMDLVRGHVQSHRDGYGFVIPEDGGDDLYLSPRQMRASMHGDRVLASVIAVDDEGRKEGAIVETLERGTCEVVGRYWRESGIGFVRPDNTRLQHDILIPDGRNAEAGDGQIVVAEIVEPPSHRSQPVGRVVEVLGEHLAPGMEIEIAVRAYGLPDRWPDTVEREAARFCDRVDAKAVRGREDLRDVALVTIDGADARDFDDAVYCKATPKGWRLLVAIADVGAYVAPGSALDEEARRRGNSVYFPGRVLPMLPTALSNGLCSLNPDADRLCIACEMLVARDGNVSRSRFFEAVMRSHARLTYEEAAALIEGRKRRGRSGDGALSERLLALHGVYRALRGARERRGALDLDTVETRVVFGPEKKIERIEPVVRNDAHRLIEECMVAANVSAARFLLRHRMPGLYRVHEGPTSEKLSELRAFLAELGLQLRGGAKPQPRHYASLITRTRDRLDAYLVQTVLLRSLAQAVYSAANSGHFGLALEAYAHFTSPIRRYPDLVVHRAIKHRLAGHRRDEYPLPAQALVELGDHASMTERRADDATRDALTWLKCEFMEDKVGEWFEGLVTGVVSFGLFVTLDEVFVDGLVHVSALGPDYFHFDPVGHRFEGDRTGLVYKLGDRLRVRVTRVDVNERKVDFELAQRPAARSDTRRRTRGKYRRGRPGRR